MCSGALLFFSHGQVSGGRVPEVSCLGPGAGNPSVQGEAWWATLGWPARWPLQLGGCPQVLGPPALSVAGGSAGPGRKCHLGCTAGDLGAQNSVPTLVCGECLPGARAARPVRVCLKCRALSVTVSSCLFPHLQQNSAADLSMLVLESLEKADVGVADELLGEVCPTPGTVSGLVSH